MKPERVNILGINYSITYMDKPSEVDIFRRESLWGQIDFWTRTIRIYDNGLALEDVWHTIIHEILHGIVEGLHLKSLDKDEQSHEDLDLLALAIADVWFRNGWMAGLVQAGGDGGESHNHYTQSSSDKDRTENTGAQD